MAKRPAAKKAAAKPEPKNEHAAANETAKTAGSAVAVAAAEAGTMTPTPRVVRLLDTKAEALIAAGVDAYRNLAVAHFAQEKAETDEQKAEAGTGVAAAMGKLEAFEEAARAHVQDVFAELIERAGAQTSQSAAGELAARVGAEGGILVRVKGPKQGRWRAGRQWVSEPSEAVVSKAELEALKADPRLVVETLPG